MLHGNGLRYIRVEEPANLRAVGVGTDLSDTFTDALTSLRNNGVITDYRKMVGIPSSTDPLDNWVSRGNTFTVSKQENAVQLTLKGVSNATYRGESFTDAVQQAFPEK